jgi:hypothetical protein
MKREIFLEGKRGWAAAALQGLRLRTGGAAASGIFTFEEKRTTNFSRETCRWTREGAR